MTSKPVALLLADLSVTKSHSRPHVSDDNPFSEAQFKTLKYRPEFPARFGSEEHARAHCRDFFPWYNNEHHHAGIGYLHPARPPTTASPRPSAPRAESIMLSFPDRPSRRFSHRPPGTPSAASRRLDQQAEPRRGGARGAGLSAHPTARWLATPMLASCLSSPPPLETPSLSLLSNS